MDERIIGEETEVLIKAILSLENEEEVYNFLVDLLTIPEFKALAQRLFVAKMLNEGAHYNEIAEKTGASSATISRVKRFLEYGSNGYKAVLPRIVRNP